MRSVGTPRTDVEVRVVDDDGRELPTDEVSEVTARGHVVMHSYWNEPDATAEVVEGGWLHTGDVGSFDSDGYLTLHDRASPRSSDQDDRGGVLATFDGPGRAVRCAQALVESVRSLGIEVCADVHTGEIELRGDDVGGIGVHIAARVSNLAAAGEVLVSRTVTDLVAESGLEIKDRGEQELKGVPGSWRVYSVLD